MKATTTTHLTALLAVANILDSWPSQVILLLCATRHDPVTLLRCALLIYHEALCNCCNQASLFWDFLKIFDMADSCFQLLIMHYNMNVFTSFISNYFFLLLDVQGYLFVFNKSIIHTDLGFELLFSSLSSIF